MKRLLIILLFALPLMAQSLDWTKIAGAKIAVPFTVQTSEGTYKDTLYYTSADWATVTQVKLDAAKTARADAWVAIVVAAKSAPPVEPTKEELLAQKAILEVQLADVNMKIAAIDAKTVVVGKLK